MCTCEPPRERRIGRRGFLAGLGSLTFAAPISPLAAIADPAIGETPAARVASNAIAMSAPASAGPSVTGMLAGAIRRVELKGGGRLVALTFDLCQTRGRIAGYDAGIVDYLRAGKIGATFFAGGLWLETHRRQAIELAADPLFELGNHSWSHPNLHSATAERIAEQMLATEAALADIRAEAGRPRGAARARLFRFPHGSCAPAALASANAIGATVIQWDTVSGDPDGTPARTIVRNVARHVRPGSIVVMHANGRGTHTAEALKTIVPALRQQGYRFVTVPALLAAGRPVTTSACYIDHQGDTEHYDLIARRRLTPSAPAPEGTDLSRVNMRR